MTSRRRPDVFFKYIGVGGLKAVLAERSVRFSDPRGFNDPFDLQIDLRFGFSGTEFEDAFAKEMVRVAFSPTVPNLDAARPMHLWVLALREQARAAPGSERQMELAARLAAKEHRGNFEDVVRRENGLWHEWLAGIRVFCASEVNDSLLMWSHYAESHNGGVLALRAIPRLDTFLLSAEPVRYQDNLPVLTTLEEWVKRATAQPAEKAFEHYVLVKSASWEYEKEWRSLATADAPTNPYRYSELAPEELEAVYLGCRMSSTDREDAVRLVRKNFPETRIYQARKSDVQFAIEFQEIAP